MAKINGTAEANVLIGTEADDLIRSRGGPDEVRAGKGDDTVEGGFGLDTLDGGIGNDNLRGEKDDDVLIGDRGNDLLFGGKGDDVFLFASGEGDDKIGDFEVAGGDRIKFDIDGLTFKDLVITSKQGDAVIKWGDDDGASIRLDGVDADLLTRSDFLFDN